MDTVDSEILDGGPWQKLIDALIPSHFTYIFCANRIQFILI
jgi:hypothetical protein